MRSALTVAVAVVAASCAHTPPSPTLAGTVGELHFDREALTGVSATVTLTSDGSWVGWFGNVGRIEIQRTGNVIHGVWGDPTLPLSVAVTSDPRFVTIHDQGADLVLEREDGGAVPEAIVVPLWLATRYWLTGARDPSGRCVEVEGVGNVLVLVLPRRAVPYEVGLEEGCRVSFTEPVVQGGHLELDPGP
jgi:hypothetical protein